MKGLLSIGTESIAFQNGMLFKELTMVFSDLLTRYRKEGDGDYMIDFAQQLATVIANRTKIKVKIDFGIMGPSVELPDLTRNHALYDDLRRNYFSGKDGIEYIAKNGFASGSVNLLTSTVSGIFAEVVSTIYIPKTAFAKPVGRQPDFTAEELASITCHEIGHVFVYFEFMVRSVLTAVVLNSISNNWKNSSAAERTAVLTTAAKALKLKELDVPELAKASESRIVEVIIVRQAVEQVTDEIGANVYDRNNFEYLADEFAARHGCGRHLVTALDKIYRAYRNIQYRSTTWYIIVEVLKYIFLFGGLSFITGIMVAADTNHPDYDRPVDRLRRIKLNLIEQTKYFDTYPPAEKERILADIKAIDEIAANVKDHVQWIEMIIDKVPFADLSKARKQRDLQRQLEMLASSSLFVKAAQLAELK